MTNHNAVNNVLIPVGQVSEAIFIHLKFCPKYLGLGTLQIYQHMH